MRFSHDNKRFPTSAAESILIYSQTFFLTKAKYRVNKSKPVPKQFQIFLLTRKNWIEMKRRFNWLHRKRDGIHFRFLWLKVELSKKKNKRNCLTKSNIVRKVPAFSTFIVKEQSGTALCFGCNAGRWRAAPPRRAFISAGSRFGARCCNSGRYCVRKPAPRASYASVRVRGPSVRSHVCVSARAFVPHDKTQTEPASHSDAMTQAKKGALWAGGETPFEIWLKQRF